MYLNATGPIAVQVLDHYLHPISEVRAPDSDNVRRLALDFRALRLPERFCLSFKLGPGAELYTFSFGPALSLLPLLDAWE